MPSIYRQLFLSFLLGVLVGLCLLFLFSGQGHPPTTVVAEAPAHTKALLAAEDRRHQTRLDSLDRINSTLQQTVGKTQVALAQAKKQNRSLQATIKDLLTVHYTVTDTVTLLANCDSLAHATDSLVIQVAIKDSLYDDLTANLQTQVTLRDSIAHIQQVRYDSLQASYGKTLSEQEALLQENAAQKKAIRKQKRGKGFVTALLGVVAGLFAFSTVK